MENVELEKINRFTACILSELINYSTAKFDSIKLQVLNEIPLKDELLKFYLLFKTHQIIIKISSFVLEIYYY